MRLSLVEYGTGIEVSEDIRPLIESANKVIQRVLLEKRNALVMTDGKLRALGIAGTIRLSKDIELEIIPKMLGNQEQSSWKESLFLLSALSKYGNIITSEHIHSSTAYQDSLYDIAGRILAREYSAHRRKPIRQYRRERFNDFSIDGEIDFELAFEKNPDGIPQEKVSFDKVNPYNATIREAMRIVLPYVKDISIRQALNRAVQELGPLLAVSRHRLKVPARNREWTDIYHLAFDIVSGMGSTLEKGEIMSPSFIADTWRIWEWLITTAFRVGLGSTFRVVPQAAVPWGKKKTAGKTMRVNVFPDIAVYDHADSVEPVFLVDAKYKVLSNEYSAGIDRSDLYEAFAFCHATGAKKLFLAYPTAADEDTETGNVTNISNYEIDGVTISAIKVAFGSITKQGDITAFCRKLSSEVLPEVQGASVH